MLLLLLLFFFIIYNYFHSRSHELTFSYLPTFSQVSTRFRADQFLVSWGWATRCIVACLAFWAYVSYIFYVYIFVMQVWIMRHELCNFWIYIYFRRTHKGYYVFIVKAITYKYIYPWIKFVPRVLVTSPHDSPLIRHIGRGGSCQNNSVHLFNCISVALCAEMIIVLLNIKDPKLIFEAT